MFSEVHSGQRKMLIHDILDKMRHDGCGGHGRRWSCSPASRASQQPACAQIVLREGL